MPKTTVHAANALNVTIDGQKVTGFADGDDALTVERNADIGELVVGALGDSIFSQSADRSARITLKLLQTSATHRLLAKRLKRQERGIPTGLVFTFKDRVNGEGGQATVFIMTAPTIQKGKNPTTREWVLVTGDMSYDTPTAV